ncbi:hypothetical protein FBUS_06253 [Fasciolopsis buskii]|uniref:Uncharacterized protein n=1 Tax=Fasciolopsis buskii TaxID=27845 RepID=A0A8E0S7E7_9TREM|nr:hypothetical protein FBUS_06253 [Fasciolopsis buski]
MLKCNCRIGLANKFCANSTREVEAPYVSLLLSSLPEVFLLIRFEISRTFLSYRQAALRTRWPGRCETVRRKNATYFIDGAHTDDSIQVSFTVIYSLTSPLVRQIRTLFARCILKLIAYTSPRVFHVLLPPRPPLPR